VQEIVEVHAASLDLCRHGASHCARQHRRPEAEIDFRGGLFGARRSRERTGLGVGFPVCRDFTGNIIFLAPSRSIPQAY